MAATRRIFKLNGLDSAHPFHFALLQYAQELGLQQGREFAHLVQENRAAVCHLQLALLLRKRARKRAAFVPEQFAFEQVFSQSGAIDGHEGTGRPQAVAMHRAGDQLLAGSALAQDQHIGIGRRHFGNLALQIVQLVAHAYHAVLDPEFRLQAHVFFLQPAQDGGILPRHSRHAGHRGQKLEMSFVETMLGVHRFQIHYRRHFIADDERSGEVRGGVAVGGALPRAILPRAILPSAVLPNHHALLHRALQHLGIGCSSFQQRPRIRARNDDGGVGGGNQIQQQ